jgi:hypothetical protein
MFGKSWLFLRDWLSRKPPSFESAFEMGSVGRRAQAPSVFEPLNVGKLEQLKN